MTTIRERLHHYLEERGVRVSHFHTRGKIREETDELLEAIKKHRKKDTQKTLEHVMEETADVVWALASNAEKYGFTLEEALELKTRKDRGRNKSRLKG